MARLDLGNVLVDGGVGVLGGGVQRLAWEASKMTGILATGALMVGGVAIQAMVDQPLLQRVGGAAAISGATVAGWVTTEKYMITGPPRTPLSLEGQRQEALQDAQRNRVRVEANAHAKRAFAMVDEREITTL